ncbi:MAG: hypothetical protein GYA55_08935 [SAR324 cluster bacterium]|uniref:Uncharacterized protein n=1 Tax=SAR324 cluster bacterium TaxID=2024889 RepID=A0A7X9FT07_9DELT|nr:hypothetical protein [SAR324 cluster bacterium]
MLHDHNEESLGFFHGKKHTRFSGSSQLAFSPRLEIGMSDKVLRKANIARNGNES